MPLRNFGSVSKGELLKTMFYPITYCGGPITWDAPRARAIAGIGVLPIAVIDNATHVEAAVCGAVPANVNLISARIYLVIVGMANTNNMHVNFGCYESQNGQAEGAAGSTGEFPTPFNTVAGQIQYLDFTAQFGVPLIPNALIYAGLHYRAADAHAATNLGFIGMLITW